jgi:hypothetical protein
VVTLLLRVLVYVSPHPVRLGANTKPGRHCVHLGPRCVLMHAPGAQASRPAHDPEACASSLRDPGL